MGGRELDKPPVRTKKEIGRISGKGTSQEEKKKKTSIEAKQ